MKKVFVLTLVFGMLFGALAGCAPAAQQTAPPVPTEVTSSQTPGEQGLQMEPVKLIANSTANPGTAEVIALETFKEKIEESTGGLITVEVYSSGTLFSSDTETTALSSGEIDMCITSFDWFVESGSAWVSMFNAPYLFASYDDAYAALTGESGTEAMERLSEEQGVKILVPAYIGTRQLILRKETDVRTTADLKGVLLRVPTTATYVAMADAMGAVATPMALDEVYLALQTGAIDAIEVPLSVMSSRKFYEVCKTLVLTNHLVNMKVITMNGDTWAALPDEARELVLEAAREAGLACDNTVLEQEKSLIQEMEGYGLRVVEPDVAEFRSNVLESFMSNQELVGDWDLALYEEITN